MLRTCAEAANKQGRDENRDAGAETGKHVAEPCERSTERQDRRGTETFGHKARRNLEASQRSGKNRSHQPERGKAETELALPDRQHDVNEIGVPIMQGVRAAGNAESAPLGGFRRDRIGHRRVVGRRAHRAAA